MSPRRAKLILKHTTPEKTVETLTPVTSPGVLQTPVMSPRTSPRRKEIKDQGRGRVQTRSSATQKLAESSDKEESCEVQIEVILKQSEGATLGAVLQERAADQDEIEATTSGEVIGEIAVDQGELDTSDTKVTSEEGILKEDIDETMHKEVDRLLKSVKKPVFYQEFRCHICSAKFKYKFPHMSRAKLKKHLELHSGIRYQCIECNKLFTTARALQNHEKGMHLKQFLCNKCGKTFYDKHTLERHVLHIHSNPTDVEKLPYECSKCDKRFHNNRHLKGHMISDHHEVEQRFTCEKCGRGYVYEKSLKTHVCPPKQYSRDELMQMGFPNVDSAFRKDGESFVCLICNFNAASKNKVKQHVRHHFEEFSLNCGHCGKIFKTKADLDAHVAVIHLKQKDFRCYICGDQKTFSYRRCVQEHIRKVHKMNWQIYCHQHNLSNSGQPMSGEHLLHIKPDNVHSEDMRSSEERETRKPIDLLSAISQGLVTVQEVSEVPVTSTQAQMHSTPTVIEVPPAQETVLPLAVAETNMAQDAVESAVPTSIHSVITGLEGQTLTGLIQGDSIPAPGESVTVVQESSEGIVQEQYIALDPQQAEMLSIQQNPNDSETTIYIEYAN